MVSYVNGINFYIKKLEAIQKECGDNILTKPVEKDPFIRTKKVMMELIHETRVADDQRREDMARRGICQETIEKGHECRKNVQELRRMLPELQQIHKKATGKRNAAAKKDELSARYQDIRQLKKLVDEVRERVEQGDARGSERYELEPSPVMQGLRESARGDTNTSRAMDEDEMQALAEMRERDKAEDQKLQKISNMAGAIKDAAQHASVTIEGQTAKAKDLCGSADKNTAEMEKQTGQMKKIQEVQRRQNTICQMVLGLLLLCVVGFVMNQMGIGPVAR